MLAAMVFVAIGLYILQSRTPVQAAYYVSPSGSDANPGTESQPFATLAKARDVVRTKTAGMTGDIIVYLRGGTHALRSPLALTAADSGTNGFNVIWKAYAGERPVISGGQRITGWTQYDASKNLWRANVGTGLATRQLYINGTRGQRARSTLRPTGFTRTSTGWTTTNTSMASWRNITDIEMTGFKAWKHFYCGVASISRTSITMQEPCWTRTQSGRWPFDTVAYVENAYELTDQPGEWYYDQPAGYLYYIPRSTENMTTAEVIAPKLEKLIDGQGTTSAPVHHIQFYGLTFAYATWNFPGISNEGYNPSQTGVLKLSDGSRWVMPGNLHFTAARNLRFEHNLFMHLGAAALNLGKASQKITIIANKFDDIAGTGIALGNVDDPGQTNTNSQNRFLTVQDNFITHTGADYYDVSGIFAGYIDSLSIQHNEIFNISHSPVTFGWGWGTNSYAKNNNVGYNWLHKFMQILYDSAGVYTLSPQPGSQIHHNYIDQAINRYGCLYPDEGSAYMNWHHNVCSRVYQWLHLWTASIHDNTIQYNYSDGTSQENNGTNNTVSNNTLITNGAWPAEAQAIMSGAGLESAYADVKTISFPAPAAPHRHLLDSKRHALTQAGRH